MRDFCSGMIRSTQCRCRSRHVQNLLTSRVHFSFYSVLDIFYDVLALQFISELDDMAFSLCKLEVLGRKLQRACTAKLYQTEFERKKFKAGRKASIFLKSVYFINLAAALAGMGYVTKRQDDGYFQCDELTVDFGGEDRSSWLYPSALVLAHLGLTLELRGIFVKHPILRCRLGGPLRGLPWPRV